MELILNAALREGTGKGKVSKMRQKGMVPGVLYSAGHVTEHVSIDAHDFSRVISKGGAGKLISLKLQSGKTEREEHVLIKESQRHPVKGNYLHVDFLRVAMDKLVTVKVPVHLVNEEKRVRDGAVLEMLLHEVEISCLPGSIPNNIGIDVSKLAMGAGIHIKDLQLPEGVKAVNPPEEPVLLATAPTTAVEATAEAAPEAAVEKKEAE